MIGENLTVIQNETNVGRVPVPFEYVVGVGVPLLAGTAVLFNTVTLFVMYAFCGPLGSHYVLIVVQCSADLLAAFCYVVFYLVPNNVNPLLPALTADRHFCLSRSLIDLINASFALALLNILAMTIDRLLAVRIPLRYATLARTRRMKALAFLMVVLSASLACTPFLATVSRPGQENGTSTLCRLYYESVPFGLQIDKALIGLDTVVMIVVYSYILHRVRLSPATRHGTGSMYRTTTTSLWIIVTFMACYWPDVISCYVDFSLPVHYLIKSLPLVNCLVDPVIYAIRLTKIQTGFRKFYSRIKGSPSANLYETR